ncbi:MAG: TVP38/TMEM64 family protein [Phycisphaerales bacterium]
MSTVSPNPAPADSRWPLRPRLSLLLFAGLLVSLVVLVLRDRGESTVASAIAGALALPERPIAPTATLRVIAYQSDEGWKIADLDAEPEHLAAARADIAEHAYPCVEYTVTLRAHREGFWAPVRQKTEYAVTRAPCNADNPPPPLDHALAADSLVALADHLADRTDWAPIAPSVRMIDSATDRAAGDATRWLKKGLAHNAVATLLAALLAFSLTPRRGFIHEAYDDAVLITHKLGVAAALGFLWTAAPAVLGIALLYFLGDIAAFLRTDLTFGWFGYVAVFIVSAGIGFLPTYGQSFLGGWVFGFRAGFPGAMLGFVGGSIIGYHIAQRVSKDRVMALLESDPKARRVRNALVGRGFWKTLAIVTLIRIPPNSPFALTNLVLASAGVNLLPFIIGTAVGMAPRTAIAVWVAAKGSATGARDIQQFIESQPWWVIPAGFAVLFIVLAIIGAIANRALHEVTREPTPDLDPAARP